MMSQTEIAGGVIVPLSFLESGLVTWLYRRSKRPKRR